MNPRKQLDVRWRDFGYGLLACTGLVPPLPEEDLVGHTILSARPDSLVFLSVRSGFDLLLQEMGWAKGDEVLVSAITIPDMSRILAEHGLRAVPVDVDPATLLPDEAALARAVTPRTRAVLVAHLFGARLPLEPLIAWAQARGLMFLEDCAQAFTGDGFEGHEASDVRMFSFGTIKTATAFGGGVLLFKDRDLQARLAQRHAQWPVQSTGAYAQRLLKFGAYHLFESPGAYGFVFKLIQRLGGNPDHLITHWGRGFAGGDFFSKLRRRPSLALQRMIAYRLANYDPKIVKWRAQAGEYVLAVLDRVKPLGAGGEHRTHWLFPLPVGNADALMATLAKAGFDATRASSSLHALPDSGGAMAPRAQAAMAAVIYVPVYAAMGKRRLSALARLLNTQAVPPGVSPQSTRRSG